MVNYWNPLTLCRPPRPVVMPKFGGLIQTRIFYCQNTLALADTETHKLENALCLKKCTNFETV